MFSSAVNSRYTLLWQTGQKGEMLDTDRIDGAKRRGAAHISSSLSSALQTFN